MTGGVEIGVLLPHFGAHCTVERLIGHVPRLEQLGYDSVWARDNLAYVPHEFESPDRCFVEPFVALAAVAGATRTLGLGTAVVAPFRAPAVTAQLLGSLCWTAAGRVQFGIGFGSPKAAFRATGVPFADRYSLCEQTIALVRGLGGVPVDGVELDSLPQIEPGPPGGLTIWFGGSSPRSLRLASRTCDGLLFARADLATMAGARRRLAELDPTAAPLRCGTVVPVLPGTSVEDALREVDVDRLLRELSVVNGREYESVQQAEGAVVAGSSEDCAEGLSRLVESGVDLLVLDLRMSADRYEHWTEWLAADVLPQVAGGFGKAGVR